MNRSGRIDSFWMVFGLVTGAYLLFIVVLLWSIAGYAAPSDLWEAINSREIRHAIGLSFWSCTVTAGLALVVAVPAGYLLARGRFPGRSVLEAILDIPIVLPPMVVGLCLLVFFRTLFGRFIEEHVLEFTFTAAGVVLAQFVIATAFATRTMRDTFAHLSPRAEDVAMTLGCTRWGAFLRIAVPSARRGMLAAATIAWARSLGEFGPILVFCGAMRMRTEVLPTTIWLEFTAGRLEAAVAVSLLLVAAAFVVLALVRALGIRVTS